MHTLLRVTAVAALLILGIPLGALAQTPKIQSPQIQKPAKLPWLASLTVNPASFTVPNMASGTCTVNLLRPAIEPMQISIGFVGGTMSEAFSHLNGITMHNTIHIPAGGDRGTVSFFQDGSATPATGTITIEARYGQERITGAFTLRPAKSPGRF